MIINGVTILSLNIELERLRVLDNEIIQLREVNKNIEDINETVCNIRMKKIISH